MPKSKFRSLLINLFFLFVAGGSLIVNAQVDTASLTGQITDSQGAVVAGARVVVINQTTNISTETTTNNDGYYTLYQHSSEHLRRNS